MSRGVQVFGVEMTKQKLGRVKSAMVNAQYRSVNKSLQKGKTAIRRNITEKVTLKSGYVSEQLNVVRATKSDPSGRVYARSRGLLLSRFTSSQRMARVKWPTKSRGRPEMVGSNVSYKAIPAGKKLKAMAVKVLKKGSRKVVKLFPLRLKNSGAIGLAVRTGPSKSDYKVLYGPSPSQIFRRDKPELERQIALDFGATLQQQLRYEIGRVAR